MTAKKHGAAKPYEELDTVINRVLAVPHAGTEALYDMIIYFFAEAARKPATAANIFEHDEKWQELAPLSHQL